MEIKLVKTLLEWQEIYFGAQALQQEAIPVKEAYWLARDLDRIETAVKHLDPLRLKLLEELADKDDEGKPIMLDTPGVQGRQYQIKENWQAFQDAWQGVIDQEMEVWIFQISIEKIAAKLEIIKPVILKSVLCLFTD